MQRTRRRRAGRAGCVMAFGMLLLAAAGVAVADDARQRAMAEADSLLGAVAPLPFTRQAPTTPGVRDPVFGFLINLLDRGTYGEATAAHFAQAVAQSGRASSIPHELITAIRRAPGRQPGAVWVRAAFTEPLAVAVPYSILGYHPGSLVSSQVVTLEEWRTPRIWVPHPRPGGAARRILIEDITLWGVVSGSLLMDIDGWLDALMGSKLDDTFIVGVGLFRYEARRYAIALGFSRNGEGRSGVLDVERDKICFPAPVELKAVGRELRGRVVRHLARRGIPAWAPPAQDG